MKLNLSNFKPTDLNGESPEIPDLWKILGNEIFKEAVTIEQTDIARAIHKGEEFEISQHELDLLIQFLTEKPLIRMWIQASIVEHLKSLKPIATEAEIIDGE